jgi:hypothetical protein
MWIAEMVVGGLARVATRMVAGEAGLTGARLSDMPLA